MVYDWWQIICPCIWRRYCYFRFLWGSQLLQNLKSEFLFRGSELALNIDIFSSSGLIWNHLFSSKLLKKLAFVLHLRHWFSWSIFLSSSPFLHDNLVKYFPCWEMISMDFLIFKHYVWRLLVFEIKPFNRVRGYYRFF